MDGEQATDHARGPRDSSSLGHLAEFRITGLFGTHDLACRLDLKEPTLLTGTNGSGKSTVLKIINAIGTGDWATLVDLPISTVDLLFESGLEFGARIHEDGMQLRVDNEFVQLPLQGNREELLRHLPESMVTHLIKMKPSDRLTELELMLGSKAAASYMSALGLGNMQDWPTAFSDFVNNFHLLFITDQRLVVSDERLEAIKQHRPVRTASNKAAEFSAHELSRLMQRALSEYASESQRLDRDFPQRVVRAMASPDVVPLERIKTLLAEVENERVALQTVGLLPRDLSASAFQDLPLEDEKVRPVIETFVQDTRRKFAVLADLRERLTVFVEYLNQHYENKRVVAQPREGFVVRMDGDDQKRIEPSGLSSGEQQILVLAYEVLFRSEPETLVLIDEPELSLHVLWQDSFIEDLTRMGTLRNLQFVLATHSPSLIGGREDLKRSLDHSR